MIETPVTEKTSLKQPAWLTLLRIILGFILFWKGIVFIRDTELLKLLIEHTGIGVFSKNSEALAFIVSYLSLLCGLFIATGLFTKTSCMVQIPILFIAVFFINIKNIGETGVELVLSIITFILLILFAFKGSGTLSADEYFRTYYKAGSSQGNTKRFMKK